MNTFLETILFLGTLTTSYIMYNIHCNILQYSYILYIIFVYDMIKLINYLRLGLKFHHHKSEALKNSTEGRFGHLKSCFFLRRVLGFVCYFLIGILVGIW